MAKPERQKQEAPNELLGGLVERVTFHNEGSGFCVLRSKARGHKEAADPFACDHGVACAEAVRVSFRIQPHPGQILRCPAADPLILARFPARIL